MNLADVVKSYENFPEDGILFRDISPILRNPEALRFSVNRLAETLEGVHFDYIMGPESRGFIFGVPLSYSLNKGFIPVRKKGKLPGDTIIKEYDLEYGTAILEIQKDAIKAGSKIVIVDDLLATGGTCKAITEMLNGAGAEVVAMSFLIELTQLKGRELLEGYNIHSILKY